MSGKNYFFTPRVKRENYEKGFRGYKTLIVGAGIPCDLTCRYKEECGKDSAPYNDRCPQYTERTNLYQSYPDYYLLSNENEIEVQSFLEGDRSPIFSSFSKYMMNCVDSIGFADRAAFWDSVAFYNYHQTICVYGTDNTGIPHIEDTERNYLAFCEILEELQPEIIYVWFSSVRNILVGREIEGLREVDSIIANGTTTYRFIYQTKVQKNPEDIVKDFQEAVPDVSENKLHAAFLEAVLRNRTMKFDSDESEEMKKADAFAQSYTWNERLCQYLIQKLEEKDGITDILADVNRICDLPSASSVLTSLYLRIPVNKSIETKALKGFSPSLWAYFSFTPLVGIREISGRSYEYLVAYINEGTSLTTLKTLLEETSQSRVAHTLLIYRLMESPPFASIIIDTKRITRLHQNGDFGFVELLNTASPWKVEVSQGKDILKISHDEMSKDVLPKEDKRLYAAFYLEQKGELTTVKSQLAKELELLSSKKLIEMSESGKYKFTEGSQLEYTKEIKSSKAIINKKTHAIRKGILRGAIFFYLSKKGGTLKDVALLFEGIKNEKEVTDKIRDFRNKIRTIEGDEDIDYTVIDRVYLKRLEDMIDNFPYGKIASR